MIIRVSIAALVTLLASNVAFGQPKVAPNEVQICEHPDFLGTCHSFLLEPGMRQRLAPKLPAGLDDEVSSIAVGSEVAAVAFTHPDFHGHWTSFFGFERDLKKVIREQTPGKHWNNWLSSLIIARPVSADVAAVGEQPSNVGIPIGVVLWRSSLSSSTAKAALALFAGQTVECVYPVPQDSSKTEARFPSLGDWMNDEAEHVSLYGNVEVELYEHPNFQGKRLDLPAGSGKDRFRLDCCQMDGKVSSLIVRSRGPKMIPGVEAIPPSPPERSVDAGMPKHLAPPGVATPAIIPGQIAAPGSTSLALKQDTNLPGHDYRNFELGEARPELCRDACTRDPRCKAFTYVKPGVQGQHALCWLKEQAARPEPDSRCVSGVKK